MCVYVCVMFYMCMCCFNCLNSTNIDVSFILVWGNILILKNLDKATNKQQELFFFLLNQNVNSDMAKVLA